MASWAQEILKRRTKSHVDSSIGLPISRVSNTASVSVRSFTKLAIFRSTVARYV